MLCEITIENVAVIEKASAELASGFNVLTGETGAGKSILIDSINAILGNRTSRDIVRSGAAKAKVWARFANITPETCRLLDAAGYSVEDELLLYREISADGKSNCRINGTPATAAILRDICGGLINIHGQHDNQSLLNPAQHIHLLDSFAANSDLRSAYHAQYRHVVALRKEMEELSMNDAEKNRRIDLLRYELDEIDAAKLSVEEEDLLVERRNIMQHSQRIVQALNTAYIALSGGDEDVGAATLLSDAAREIGDAAKYAQELTQYSEPLNEMYFTASEMASDIQGMLGDYTFDPQELNDLEQRIDLLYRLKQKYGATLEEVLSYGEKARDALSSIEFSEERLAKLTVELKTKQAQANKLADDLTQTRTKAFEKLNTEIAQALAFLNMPGIVLNLQIKKQPLGSYGQDSVEFFISTNTGELPKPLSKIASGGELARIMLALKSALADRDDLATVIYDEIDTGISGLAAGRIGQLLRKTAKGRQVICVTHTAQVAANAAHHLLIEKMVQDGRTYTHIRSLDDQGRVEELARIISGDNLTDLARANAQEMLRIAEKSGTGA